MIFSNSLEVELLFSSCQDVPATELLLAVPLERDLPKDYNAFLLIGEDGTVNCLYRKNRNGTGNYYITCSDDG